MRSGLPSAMEDFGNIVACIRTRRLALFLDFDGTLAPIVERPELAAIAPATRDTVALLASLCPVAIITGRDLEDARARIGIAGIAYAGSHGFDIAGPNGIRHEHPLAVAALTTLESAEHALRDALTNVQGALVERKRFSVATHYRLVSASDTTTVEKAVDTVLRHHPGLRKGHGKKVFELQPDIAWDKGAAVRWLLRTLGLDRDDVVPFYIGDDITDEDAFAALAPQGIGVVVLDHPRASAAAYRLQDPSEVQYFLMRLAAVLEQERGGTGRSPH